MNIPVLFGSVRSDRQGIKAARFLVNKLEERGHQAPLVDPVQYPLPLLDKMYKQFEPGKAPEAMEAIATILKAGDGFVVVSAEYNHSLPPALKNLLDHFQKEYLFKPAGIVTYSVGSFGGVRASLHLRAILGELGMVTPSTMFAISRIQDSFDEKGNALDANYNRRIKQFLDELEWYASVLKPAREKGTPF